MKITKFIHSCLLVETPERTALFDPGVYSAEALNAANIAKLDDIFITHIHKDHFSPELIKQLVSKFPQVRITATPEIVAKLVEEGVQASDQAPEGAEFFDSPHEPLRPAKQSPQEIGVHYLGKLSHPGDSHSFKETKAILALPVQAPWGSSINALKLAIELRPKYILPIHDWHWNDQARQQMYDDWFAPSLSREGIEFLKLQTGRPVEIKV